MRYRIRHATQYNYGDSAPSSQNQVRLAPRELPWQRVTRYVLLISPTPRQQGRRKDYFGNQVDYFSLHDPHLGLKIVSTSQVEVLPAHTPPAETTPAWEQLAADTERDLTPVGLAVRRLTFDSKYAFGLPAARQYAAASFPPGRPILAAAADLMHRIHRDFKYDGAATTIETPLTRIFADRRGVCQDFAHAGVAALRSLGIPARYVSGYLRTEPPEGRPRLVGADASHAWFSVFCGKAGWVDLDPTNDLFVGVDHVTVAWGRDYGDVCPIEGVFTGGGAHSMTVSVDVQPLG